MAKLVKFWPGLVALLLTITLLTQPVPTYAQLPAQAVVQAADDNSGNSYLDKLFGSFAGQDSNSSKPSTPPAYETGPLGWLLAIVATIFYGEIALAAILWILFSSDLVGIITALSLVALSLAFVLPRRPRPIALLVLAGLNFFLAAGITLSVAFSEGLPPVLISLLPVAALLWLAVRNIRKNFAPQRAQRNTEEF